MTKVMRTCVAIILLVIAVAAVTEAARFRSSRSRFRFSYRYRSLRTRYRYSRSYGYGHRDLMSSRRLSPSVMGPLYFSYASRYPNYFNYRRSSSPMGWAAGGKCTNYLALSNGSYIGAFSCPFLPDEPSNWTRCCGYEKEEFCCDPKYDDSWKYMYGGLSGVAIALIVCSCIAVAGIVIGVAIFCCCCCCVAKTAAGGSAAPTLSGAQGKPFVDPTSKQSEADGSSPVQPPYPPMEYGTMQQPAATTAGTAPYPPMPTTPYPPPYSPN